MRAWLCATMLCLGLFVARPGRAESCGAPRPTNRNDSDASFALAEQAWKSGNIEAAIDAFRRAVALAPDPATTRLLADKLADRQVFGDKYLREAFNTYEDYLRDFSDTREVLRKQVEAAQAQLAPELSIVHIRTEPANAELFVDTIGQYGTQRLRGTIGCSERRYALEPTLGRPTPVEAGGVPATVHVIMARKPGYRDARVEVAVRRGEPVAVSLELERKIGSVVVESDPPGAEVRVEGKTEVLLRTPGELSWPEGDVRLEVALPAHATKLLVLAVRDGERQVARLKLEPDLTRHPRLTITSSRPRRGARVTVDGRDIGVTPIANVPLPAGAHQVELTAARREPWRGTVVMEPGMPVRLDGRLVERRWKWIAYGVGAAAAVAGVAVGIRARGQRDAFYDDPDRGTYDRVQRLNRTADVLMASGVVVAAATFTWHMTLGRSRAEPRVIR